MSNELTFLKDLDIRGQKVKVYVRADGRFASAYPHEVSSETFEGLRANLMKLLKKATTRLEIPVTVQRNKRSRYSYSERSGSKLVQAVLRGRHGGNRNILIEWEDKKGTEQLSSYDYQKMFRSLTEEEQDEWRRLTDDSLIADAALRAWVEEREIDPGKLVDEALNKAADKEDE